MTGEAGGVERKDDDEACGLVLDCVAVGTGLVDEKERGVISEKNV